jgi:hypothetical protein
MTTATALQLRDSAENYNPAIPDALYGWKHRVELWLNSHETNEVGIGGGKRVQSGRRPKLGFEAGKRYIRVVETAYGANRSVFCFLDYEGNIYKAESWKKPAKHVRGHITDANDSIGKGITQYGGAYLR